MKKAIQWWDIGNSCVIGRIHSIVFFEPQKTRNFLRWDLQLCGSGDSSPLTIRPSPCVNSQTFFFHRAPLHLWRISHLRPMIPGYCFWWLGRGGGLLILYSENAVIFFPNILELKKYISKVPRSNIPVWGVHQSKIVSPSVKRCALRLHWCIFHMKYFFFCFGPWYRVKLVYYSTRQLHPGAD